MKLKLDGITPFSQRYVVTFDENKTETPVLVEVFDYEGGIEYLWVFARISILQAIALVNKLTSEWLPDEDAGISWTRVEQKA